MRNTKQSLNTTTTKNLIFIHLDERSDLDAYHTVKNVTYELIIFSALWENDKGPFLFGEITG